MGETTKTELKADEANADLSVTDTEADAGDIAVNDAGRPYDPSTGRFVKRKQDDDGEADDAPPVRDDPRARIAKQFQEMRQKARDDGEEPDRIPLPKQLITGMTDEEVAEQAGLAKAEAAGEEPGETIAPAKPVEQKPSGPLPLHVVVDGQFLTVDRNDPRWFSEGATDDQVRRTAQLTLAAEARFAKSKSNQVSQEGEPTHQTASQEPSEASPSSHTQGIDKAKLGEIAQRLQYGSEDEAADALLELTKLTSAPAQQQPIPDFQAEVRRAIIEQNNQSEIERAVTSFEEKNGDLTGNKYLQQVVLDVAVDTMLEDMKRIGVPDELIEPIRGKGKVIAQAYRNMRLEGLPLRTHEEVLQEAGDKVRQTFNMPRSRRASEADRSTIEQRVEQKRQMQQQPRSAGVRQQPAQAPRPLTRAEHIQAEKARRMPWA